ncbi:hypothetical protein QC762_0098300 [Podospora pseudocomata]|uniref:Protein kinase domain-containing protein n=1 Tax=Podospora pseudocomata TaxID=2093779 RepID=A0ABR0G894_9PEZI|nr:hypothetical protein QC762_0098300 [Podospora pseudocomata]
MAQPNQGQPGAAPMQGVQMGGGQVVPQQAAPAGFQVVDPQKVTQGPMTGQYTGPLIRDGKKQKYRWSFYKFREEGFNIRVNDVVLPDPYLPPMVPFPKMYKGPSPSTKFPHSRSRTRFAKIFGAAFFPGGTPNKFTKDPLAPAARDTLKDYLDDCVLGWGGNGLACLFQGTDGTGKTRPVVAKTTLRPGHAHGLLQEAGFQEEFEDCEHIVQLEDMSEFQLPIDAPAPGERLPSSNPTEPVATPHVILLEYLANGSLAQVISNLWYSGTPRPPPNWFLWEIWQCMLRAIFEFEFPRNKRAYNDRGLIDTTLMDLRGENNVHFDIDPSNYIVGDRNEGYPDDSHGLVPILKMSDFGLSIKVTPEILRNP